MGWDTYLHIGHFHDNWRKHAPSIAALPFTVEDYAFRRDDPDREDDGEDVLRAYFVSSVKTCRSRLNNLGFNWNFMVKTYAEYRADGFASGALMAALMTNVPSEDIKKKLYKDYETFSPEHDLRALVKFFGDLIEEKDEVWANDLPGGREEDHPYMFHDFHIMFPDREQIKLGNIDLDRYAAIRAGEFLDKLRYMTPDLGWIFFIRIILESIENDEKVTLDISDYTYEVIEMSEGELGFEDFGEHFIKQSFNSLADHSRLMGQMYSLLTKLENDFGRGYFIGRALGLLQLVDASGTTAQERGRYLEELVEALIRMEPKLRVLQKNLANDTEELDLVLSNQLENPFWISMQSPVIFVECKNWKTPVGASDARVFESKLRERGNICRVGIFVALNGFTEPFIKIIKGIQSQGHIIFVVTGSDIREMLDKGILLSDWLIEYGTLRII